MKKISSLVWKFFERVNDDNERCVEVVCKLCESQYKFFGNTTNLRVHLKNKHPIQWEMGQDGNFDEAFRVDDVSNAPLIGTRERRKSRKEKNVRYSIAVTNPTDNEASDGQEKVPVIEIQRVDVQDNLESDYNEDGDATLHMVRQMHAQDSDEEWLDESFVKKLENSKKSKIRVKRIKREVISPVQNRRSSSFFARTPRYESYDTSTVEEPKDEYSVFGEYIANKLRHFKTPKTRGNIQQMITTILWQAEYGMYDKADSVKRMMLFTVQEPETQILIQENNSQMQVQHEEEVQNQEVLNQSVES